MKYNPVFTVLKVNVLASEPLLRSSYGSLGMICTVKNENWTGWLPENSINKLSDELYKKALTKDFLKNYRRDSDKIIKLLNKLVSQKDKIPELSNKELFELLKDFIGWASNFFNIYNQTEFFCFTKIENEIKDYAKNPDLLSDLLSDKPLPKDLPEKTKELVILTREIQKIRWNLREAMNLAYMGDSIFVALIIELSKRTKRTDVDCLNSDEIKQVLNENNITDANGRRKLVVVYWNDNIIVETNDKASKKIKELMSVESTKEIKGTVVCSGKVKGKVCIIPLAIDASDYIARMQKNDILVAPTTGPEMMIAIQKASAIVTDEGGLMSHAAIVSRELNIPCIVGTKNATQLLKDGDLVEVDAIKGIVKILK